jgi:hypothetical protein
MFMPGVSPFQPVDLSSKQGLAFRARGDGKAYVVLLFTQKTGRRPLAFPFTPGRDLAPVEIPWTAFAGADPSGVTAILVGQAAIPGKFELFIDDLELR